jgi:hypothetical protein
MLCAPTLPHNAVTVTSTDFEGGTMWSQKPVVVNQGRPNFIWQIFCWELFKEHQESDAILAHKQFITKEVT